MLCCTKDIEPLVKCISVSLPPPPPPLPSCYFFFLYGVCIVCCRRLRDTEADQGLRSSAKSPQLFFSDGLRVFITHDRSSNRRGKWLKKKKKKRTGEIEKASYLLQIRYSGWHRKVNKCFGDVERTSCYLALESSLAGGTMMACVPNTQSSGTAE
jgi:hypothetical protein